jgi:hypothetical protein
MSVLTEKDMQILDDASPETMAEWAEQLNGWEWPEVFDDPCDGRSTCWRGYKDNFRAHVQTCRRHWLAREIEARVGRKYLLRYHNRWMTDEEFKEWWLHKGDPGWYQQFDERTKGRERYGNR